MVKPMESQILAAICLVLACGEPHGIADSSGDLHVSKEKSARIYAPSHPTRAFHRVDVLKNNNFGNNTGPEAKFDWTFTELARLRVVWPDLFFCVWLEACPKMARLRRIWPDLTNFQVPRSVGK